MQEMRPAEVSALLRESWYTCWHCSHSMQQGLGNTQWCPSVCLSHLLTTAAACGRLAAVGPAGTRHQCIAARPVLSVTLSADVGNWTDACRWCSAGDVCLLLSSGGGDKAPGSLAVICVRPVWQHPQCSDCTAWNGRRTDRSEQSQGQWLHCGLG